MKDIWMIIACTIPLLLLFILPLLGINSPNAVFLLIITMFILHIFMMRGHGEDHKNKEASRGCH